MNISQRILDISAHRKNRLHLLYLNDRPDMKEQSYQFPFAAKNDHKLNKNRHWPSLKSISLQDH